MLGNMFIATVSFPGCDVMDFEINLSFFIKSLLHMTKKVETKFKYFQNEKSFLGAMRNMFSIFLKGFH